MSNCVWGGTSDKEQLGQFGDLGRGTHLWLFRITDHNANLAADATSLLKAGFSGNQVHILQCIWLHISKSLAKEETSKRECGSGQDFIES